MTPHADARRRGLHYNFQETNSGKVATTGDFVLPSRRSKSVSPRSNRNIQVTADTAMLTEPNLGFLHAPTFAAAWRGNARVSRPHGITADLSHVATP